MPFIEILYYLTIKPLELFFEVVYMMAYRIIGSPSLAIIALSLAMNFLVLPLYRRADAMQEEERKTEERLGAGVKHIKQAFKGDERMMILQTYYRQNHYKQSYVLRGSLPLLLEVPFFIAAYRFLSSLELLQGVSFGPIADLGAPDGLLTIGGIAINVLPVLMTLINIISSSIYADHMSRKTKIQLYVMAAIFLVFLYDSPAGLVFYWTLNNLFSLVKNVFYKLPNPRKVLRVLTMLAGIAAAGYFGMVYQTPSILRKGALVGVAALLIVVPLLQIARERRAENSAVETSKNARPESASAHSVFCSAVIYLTILVGGLIPSAVIGSSPLDFISVSGLFRDPTEYVIAAFVLAAGYLLVWCSLFYGLAGEARKRQFAWIMVVLSIVATMDYMIFKPLAKSGTLSNTIVYDNGLEISKRFALMGLLAAAAVLVVVLLSERRIGRFWRSLVQVGSIVICIMTILNVIGIRETIEDYRTWNDYATNYHEEFELPLSTNGKNVVVIMLDRAIGAYIPYILQERPELIEALDGFTYYPNTLSYAGSTNMATPSLFGGYEYTPEAINERSEESLASKHDEALLTIPVLFSEEGYDVTVCDPPYAGYKELSDLSIYDAYPGINALRLQGNMNPYKDAQDESQFNTGKRNLFCYSVVRCMPLLLQKAFYNEGNYNAAPTTTENPYATDYATDGAHKTTGYDGAFMDNYLVLQNLEQITKESDNAQGSYIFMDNNMTHEAKLVQEPDYEPAAVVDNTDYDASHVDRFTADGVTAEVSTYDQLRHYESTMSALIQLGRWFDYLREQDLYDNTRIIIVSDHANDLNSFEDRILEDGTDTMRFNPLLMVKDYDAQGFETSEEFMTNADVAYLSVNGVVDNPTNPFTGNAITNEAKEGTQYVLESHEWSVTENNGNQFIAGEWLSVEGDIRELSNWSIVSENSVLP